MERFARGTALLACLAVLFLPQIASAQYSQDFDGLAGSAAGVILTGQDGFYVAECPSLPGCVSQGGTREGAITNIREAIRAYIAALEDDGLPVPEEHFDTLLVAV